MNRFVAAVVASILAVSPMAAEAQDYGRYSDAAAQSELSRIADVDIGVMVPMRDGIGLATNVYRPKNATAPLPTVFVRTPYNELANNARTTRTALTWVNRGYAFVIENERGRYFSGGDYQILGYPQTDGYDALTWIAAQPWSNGKVGTLGCSSSAEWQLALAAQNHPAHAAMVPQAAGAGIGKVGRFQEQGNWYTGGVPRSLFFVWLYGVDNPLRAQIPTDIDQKTRARLFLYNDLDAKKPEVNWPSQIRHLPVDQMLADLGEPPATFEQLIDRTPADPAWRQGGLYHDDMGWGVPSLWFNSWYDVSIGPNMELFNHARTTAQDREAAENQYVVVGPNNHCAFAGFKAGFRSGDRDLGDASFDSDALVHAWFDRWLKGERRAFPDSTPHVQYFNMGENAWRTAAQWPPAGVQTVRMYLRSGGAANSLNGDGRLSLEAPPPGETADRYRYDPMNPVQTIGGGDCCNGGLVTAGAFDQRPIEARDDVLVYTSEPLNQPMQVTGFIDAVLKVSSSAPDTDFAVKLVDVAPDGTAYILGDTIMRARYRDGYDRPTSLTPGQVATVQPTPMTISNTFLPGHRIRIEVSSSNFPKFVRNLNTGGPNESEREGRVADNAIHHAGSDASYIDLPVLK
ncbi:CocE/NonD family hydrolase [Brevundimonas sp. SORGH_AS_0993]|uniref:CocE/NonD family hydrolase n=1 Tax=Brevundimonas sp. SORGH_AS_0993 TaxID=3041794 RepID=UPI002783AB92|nr:CocE/NonD family hydrolase [Brevundimonas sp. SORGH_AS_0993]MDQ1152954.1 putative CocE/NonD family hydrolase [Brevundimonas sp. SORGH_AS_0993]